MFTDNLKSRGYLPHFDRTGYVHTVRISEFDIVPPNLRRPSTKNPYGACRLGHPAVANTIVESLNHLHQQNIINLFAYVVMPNHVHILARFNDAISDVMRNFKSFTGKANNSILGRTGEFWQPDFYDQWVETDDDFRMAKSYIEFNPVRAGLCESTEDWRFSSAFLPTCDLEALNRAS